MTHTATNNHAHLTRRSFIKSAAIATGALTLARSAHAAGKEEIRIGLIGSGLRGGGAAAQALKAGPDVKLVAMADVFEERLKATLNNLKKMFPEQVQVDDDHCFVGFDAYQKVIESVDAVLIACASKFHPMYAEAAVKAGRHVFVEKPHGIDPVGARRMQAACDLAKEKGVSIVSGLQSRFNWAWQETVKRIHDGIIGDIVAIQSMFLRGPYRLYKRPPDMPETMYHFWNWYHFRWLSGDDVTQSLVHNLDRCSWILKEEPPKWAFGLGGRSGSFGEQFGDMFDHHTVVYEYESGTRIYALCRTTFNCYNNSSDIIMGTKGVCYLGACRIEGETNWRYEGPRNNPYEEEQKALIESIRKGEPINCGDYMAKSTMIAVMGQLTCYDGRAITWDQVNKLDLQFGPPPEESNFETPPPTTPDETGNYPLPKPGTTRLW